MAKESDDQLHDLKKLGAAFVAIDPLLSRLVVAGNLSEAAEYASQRFGDLMKHLKDDPPVLWAVIRDEGGRWVAYLHKNLEAALANYDSQADLLCAAKLEGGKVWLAFDGQFSPFDIATVYPQEEAHE